MLLEDIKDANDLLEYLRKFQLWQTQEGPYDQALIVYMLLAILDNLQDNLFEPDIENVGYIFNDSQRAFIKKISDIVNTITDEQVEILLDQEEEDFKNSNIS